MVIKGTIYQNLSEWFTWGNA